MHGRIKLKTTEEQAEQKQKERLKKLHFYETTRSACFAKRKAGILDEEGLILSGQLLAANPDFATLWNFRREIFLHLKEEKNPEELQTLFEKELSFLETCLRVNPKSYGTWHHRGWVLDHSPHPDWKVELELCSKFLQFDERNFHCWDYRRLVVQRAEVSPQEELEFTHKLIGTNFSNYSSWHYRSTLLPLVYPDTECRVGRADEEALLTEYELVQNALFTDPNDQSAWFYYRWLLGRADREETVSCLYISREGQRLIVSFSHPVNVLLPRDELILFVDGLPLRVTWKSPHPQLKRSAIWICELPPNTINAACSEHNFKVHWRDGRIQRECILYKGRSESWCRDSATDQQLFRCDLSVEKTTVLQSELNSCTQLQELEPDNKWCALTIILLMRALDPLGYEKEMLQCFQTLKATDPMRTAYFDDLLSKFIIENSILKMEYAESRVVDLSKKNLTNLCHLDQMQLVTHMNLTSNRLKSLPIHLSMMQCLEVLEASDNEIESLEGLVQLPRLQEISLQNNRISKIGDLRPLASCPSLILLNLKGNPITEVPDFESELSELLPSLKDLIV
ncbi:geranylgeranyl transferase type-2 subunit alpha [Polypterus senegalus]|uniref:geranylgeranyl transferase type-2 subunit alpha n=1 Tax=Polypterus senegalus TaxID=55291 RepID=UPI0019657DE8|nr:geranylgeranyl transferase type-2 subunit alpha [Polypterus senegalus]XP_039602295.1 geranylgeranyl transferase type-2 subunit alpha [Polypterus senegalus]XP_039602302.1 geranylgeranyl transferase type-2 subunit alpha [Polypterus senegalus]